jgi:hypothetical protein
MSHVSARELRRFVHRGRAGRAFEAHVDACEACARALSAAARASLEAPPPSMAQALVRIPLEAWLAFAVLALALLASPAPAHGRVQPVFSSTILAASAGVPDAGPADGTLPPLLVAAFDAGETRN